MKYFIAVYTNECKKYADEEFFKALGKLTAKDHDLWICDNSINEEYYNELSANIPYWYGSSSFNLYHVDVSREDRRTLFLRNVTESLIWLREQFLKSDAKYFVIFESDVIVPPNVLELFEEVVEQADIIGGIYYIHFHDDNLFNLYNNALVPTAHVLSGCTLYKREVIEKIHFRWSDTNLGAFPDAWISYDAVRNGNNFKMANYAKIKCKHLDKLNSMVRGQEDLR